MAKKREGRLADREREVEKAEAGGGAESSQRRTEEAEGRSVRLISPQLHAGAEHGLDQDTLGNVLACRRALHLSSSRAQWAAIHTRLPRGSDTDLDSVHT